MMRINASRLKANYTNIIWIVLLLFIMVKPLSANDITFSGIRMGSQNTSDKVIQVLFDLKWDNSWRIGTTPQSEVEMMYIRSGGSGYTDGSYTITFSGGGATSNATANVVVSGGSVTQIVSFTKGSGYEMSPTSFLGITTSNEEAIFDVHIAPWWDAAWVFGKYRVVGTSVWNHMKLAVSGHSTGTGTSSVLKTGRVNESIAHHSTSNPNTGLFYYRSSPSLGTFSIKDAYFLWDYGTDGVLDDDEIEFSVHGIEMVYVHKGAFYLGSGGSENGVFYSQSKSQPFLVQSANAINVGSNAGELYYDCANSTNCGDQSGPIPATFPNGFNAFYAMKHEASQQFHVDFLNTLAAVQQDNRSKNGCSTIEAPGVAYMCPTCDVSQYTMNGQFYYISGMRWRCAVKTVSPANISQGVSAVFATDLPKVAAQGFNWSDIAALADWSSMRPMTELEFEKLARGSAYPVPNEFVWGKTDINTTFFNTSNFGQANEIVSSGLSTSKGNATCVPCIWQSSQHGPLRAGVFASAYSDRVISGASFYGALEMTGNVSEALVTIANTKGREFTYIHGDGEVSSSGFANMSSWPGADSTGINTTFLGAIYRGSHANDNACLPISTRNNLPQSNNRANFLGARFARTAPID